MPAQAFSSGSPRVGLSRRAAESDSAATSRQGALTTPAAASLSIRTPLLVATIGIWLLSYLGWTLEGAVLGLPQQANVAARGFVCDSVGALLCGLMYLLLRRLEAKPLALRLAAALALVSVATTAFMAMLFVAYHVIAPVAPATPRWLPEHLDTAVAIMWIFLCWCGVYFSLGLGAAARQAQAKALDAENRMLRYQLDPHFLFNIHSALATLIHDHRNSEAERTVLLLSNFLRSCLGKDPGGLVDLAEEVRVMREYVEIQATRFEHRLNFRESIDPSLEAALTPSFILQPLLENAIKHGLGDGASKMTVELGAAREGRQMALWVEDNGSEQRARPSKSTGLGLENVRLRLQALYGQGASMTAENLAPSGYRVTLKLPLVFA
jgi:two-component system, LytTR family, sensor kinase